MGGIEWFDPGLGAPMVSLAEYGLTFNRAAVGMLDTAPKVMLGFDRDKQVVAVRPLHDDDQKALNVVRRPDGYARVASKDFIRFVARYCPWLRLDSSTRFLATQEQGLILIDLSRPVDPKAGEAPGE